MGREDGMGLVSRESVDRERREREGVIEREGGRVNYK